MGFWECCCGGIAPTPCGSVCVTVKGCSAIVVGAGYLVELIQAGVVVSSCTTSSSGVCCCDVFTAGTGYSVKITPPAGSPYAVKTQSIAGTVSCTTANVTVTLSVDAGHVCSSTVCCTGAVVPTAITLTTPLGSVVLNLLFGQWVGCMSVSVANVCQAYTDPACPLTESYRPTTATIAIAYTLTCGSPWTLQSDLGYGDYSICGAGSFIYYTPTACSGAGRTSGSCGTLFGGPAVGFSINLSGSCVDGVVSLTGTAPATGTGTGGHTVNLPDAGPVALSG